MKTGIKIFTIVLAMMMLLSTTVMALPNNSVVIGNQAFSLDALRNSVGDVQGALNSAHGKLYYNLNGVTEGFKGLFSGSAMTQAQMDELGAIKYYNGDGSSVTYAHFNDECPVEGVTVASVTSVSSVTVEYGTAAATALARLPATVSVTLSDGTTRTGVAVTWSAPSNYNPAVSGTYTFTGTLGSIAGVSNTSNKVAAANIVVGDPAQANAVQIMVSNAIPSLETKAGTPLNNVVLVGSPAEIKAKVTDANGAALPNRQVIFTVNSAETFADVSKPHDDTHEYIANAAFSNGLETITAVTNASGEATARLTATITSNDVKSAKELLTDKYASTEVTYNVAANGIINTGAVSFATFDLDRCGSDVDVHITKASVDGADPVIANTLGLYPFSDEGTRATLNGLHDTEYAFGQQVSGLSGSPDNSLKVTATLDMNVYTSLVDSDIQGNKTLPLSKTLSGIKPNQTDVYTEDNLIIPDRVNYATLHFNSMSISRGTEITAYFIPDGYLPPVAVDVDPAAKNPNGHMNGQIWSYTFAASDKADNYIANDFYLQIPANCSKGQIYIVTQAPGQIDPVTDIGYRVDKIAMNYGALARLVKADVGSYVKWEKVLRIQYSGPYTVEDPERAQLASALSKWCGPAQAIDPNWTYRYYVPAYPMVGDAVVQALDGFGTIKKMWNVPTKNILHDGLINQNDIKIDFYAIDKDPSFIRDCGDDLLASPVALDAIFTTPAEASLYDDGKGVAIINSTKTGPQEIKGTLDIPGVPNTLLNALGTEIFTFAQWTVLPLVTGPITTDDVQYTLTGQKVVLKAKVTDANGNLAQSGVPVAFDIITSDNNVAEISATGLILSCWLHNGLYDTAQKTGAQPAGTHWRYYVQTNADGIATLTLSAPDVASVIAQASADAYLNPLTNEEVYFNVELSDDAGLVSPNGTLTQIDFGKLNLLYVPMQGYNQDQDYEATMNPFEIAEANSTAVVGNQQNFGILASVTWPDDEDLVFKWVFVNNSVKIVQGIYVNDVDVSGIPFEVKKYDGVGNVVPVDQTAETVYYNTTGTRDGVTHWTALSNSAGQETISVTPVMDGSVWTRGIVLKEGAVNLINAGTGLVSPVNGLMIPIHWRVGMGSAVVTVPSSTADVGGVVHIKVKVTDQLGNAIEGERVRFTLTKPEGSAAVLYYPMPAYTNAQGEFTAILFGGANLEQDGITVTVEDEVTGSIIPVTNGQQNILWQEQPVVLQYLSAVPNTAAEPNNTITLSFSDNIAEGTVDPSGAQFTVWGPGGKYALKGASVAGKTITLTLADSNSKLPSGFYLVTINSVPNYHVGDTFNNVIWDWSTKAFTIPAN